MKNEIQPENQAKPPDEEGVSGHEVQLVMSSYVPLPHKHITTQYEMFENMGIGGDLL
jgi:hypothetical protein